MNCDQFLGDLDDQASREVPSKEGSRHVEVCASCRVALARSRKLIAALRRMPPAVPPSSLRPVILASAAVQLPSRAPRRILAAAAAALLLVLGGGVLLSPGWTGPSYQPLELTVLPMAESSASDEEYALEVMYGPGIPIGDWGDSGREAGDREDHGSAHDR